ncbi:MAG TPA: NAD(P)H-dependent oxidoreductase [Steroidobacteraceae bacterium]|jgi:FMN-dependent NADH-azoreductase|nr:NAD(P)H-dependent oxidoreductase [Steroidobacteraceae bacterium]
MNILHIDASILGEGSVSRQVSARIVDQLRAAHPDAATVYRDLAATPLSHATPATLPSSHPVAKNPNDPHADRVLEEFLEADTVVIGAPMYNFTIPSQLKAWIDRIVVPGKTFKYGPQGLVGLAAGKRVILALSRGNIYRAGSPAAGLEHAESYLRTVLGFIGVAAPETVIAEGIALGAEHRADALSSSLEQAAAIDAKPAAAAASAAA